MSSEIATKYAALGGASGFLGRPVTAVQGCPDDVGFFQHYENGGSIYWTPQTGAHEVHGDIRTSVLQRLFQLFDEYPLAADFGEGYIKNLVAACRHAKYAEFRLRV